MLLSSRKFESCSPPVPILKIEINVPGCEKHFEDGDAPPLRRAPKRSPLEFRFQVWVCATGEKELAYLIDPSSAAMCSIERLSGCLTFASTLPSSSSTFTVAL